MKIQCDVCEKDEASVFCVADEASLCAACDHRVHHANKLAGKHQRFTLHHPSPKQSPPLCDICQERKALLFCQQDRAILCRECDIPIHNANEHTKKHTRFLLTGVKLSATCTLYSESYPTESASSSLTNSSVVSNVNARDSNRTPSNAKCTTVQSRPQEPCADKTNVVDQSNMSMSMSMNMNNGSIIPASSISEYLIETLPGWHVEDFLDSPSPSPYAFCSKSGENDLVSPFWNDDVHQINNNSRERMGFWVPQAPPPLHNNQTIDLAFGLPNNGFRQLQQQSDEFMNCNNTTKSSTRKRSDDNSFAVPQISPPPSNVTNKKSRTFW
ncbi:hypothetical protein ABFS83_14G296500 [Erythranthe nasuta]